MRRNRLVAGALRQGFAKLLIGINGGAAYGGCHLQLCCHLSVSGEGDGSWNANALNKVLFVRFGQHVFRKIEERREGEGIECSKPEESSVSKEVKKQKMEDVSGQGPPKKKLLYSVRALPSRPLAVTGRKMPQRTKEIQSMDEKTRRRN
ncbi:hypothetical protein HNY73_001116 [Argiope bruennichi]|uniref:Uncharacterized protein n=1 Tax=Argiope bruennichi TaxID=94029 RepID=A0A8T0G1K6_ARGBR|nr:hypothetical protein HNY73_001116 [Argiope bruennichi]